MVVLELLRNAEGLSQLELAKKLHIPRSYIASIEIGMWAKRSKHHVKLERYYNLPFDFLISQVDIKELISYLRKIVEKGGI